MSIYQKPVYSCDNPECDELTEEVVPAEWITLSGLDLRVSNVHIFIDSDEYPSVNMHFCCFAHLVTWLTLRKAELSRHRKAL